MKRAGFTLLEVLVATTIMGLAVVGMLSGISGSLRNAARLTEYDRITLAARSKMDELMADPNLGRGTVMEGRFEPELLGGSEGGWRAQVTPFEMPPGGAPSPQWIERLQLEIWWGNEGGPRRTLNLEGFRRVVP